MKKNPEKTTQHKKMTMKQIAGDLNLSRQTVSNILNGNKQKRYISQETAKKVKDYVRETGFQQDIGALSMRGKYSKNIVIVSRRRISHALQQVYFRLISHLELLNISHITTFYNDRGFPQLIQEIDFFKPQKIIVFPVFGDKSAYEEWKILRENYFINIPCFFFDSADKALLCNNEDTLARMNRHDSYREIARCMSSGRFDCVVMPRRASVSKYFEGSGVKVIELDSAHVCRSLNPGNNFYISGLLESGKIYGKQILEKSFPRTRTAAFFGDDYVCCGIIDYLRKNSVMVPEDIEFFSLAHMEDNRMLKYPFTSWQFPYGAMYKKMISWVKGGISGGKDKIFKIKKVTVDIDSMAAKD